MYVITETIHHGQYCNVRTLVIPAGAIDVDALQAWGEASPYAWREGAETAERVADALAATGEASHGWARYTLEPACEVCQERAATATLPRHGQRLDICDGCEADL